MNFHSPPRPAPRLLPLALIFFSLVIPFRAAEPPLPEWIWHDHQIGDAAPRGSQSEIIYLRKTFVIEKAAARAELKVCGDDEATVFLNGKQVVVAKTKPAGWTRANYAATAVSVADTLKPGENTLAVMARNAGGPYGVILRLEIADSQNAVQWLISDTTWLTTMKTEPGWEMPGAATAGWRSARRIGKEGDNPWFEVMNSPTTAAELTLPPGFKSEILREAQPNEGSWISMTKDDQGRLILSSQNLIDDHWGGMWRFTLGKDGRIAKEEKIELPVGAAQGLCYAHGALYVNGLGPKGLGFYRVRDSNGDDRYDGFELIAPLYNRGGSHGPHSIELGPDGALYHISGDYSRPVDATAPDSPHRNFEDDLLLPRSWDPSGHGRGLVPPMGTVQRYNPRREDAGDDSWKLFCAGLRNPYDLAFNPEGEAFTYDADMEFDIGLPWYRPTRLYHLVSGGEYGHREGTGKWPYYYPDSLPPIIDIGLGSPVGMRFGAESNFPPPYRRALFMGDWAWGNIYAVHLKPQGASYEATFEKFAVGRPLNVMDIVFAGDGSMYFITGGNDTRSALYRVTYAGASTEPPKSPAELKDEADAAQARALRRQLEAFHGKHDPSAIDFAWPQLASPDRFLRYAARLALEWQEPRLWHDRALAETHARAALTALLGVARTAKPEAKPTLLDSLRRLDWKALSESEQLELIRIYGVAFARLGGPAPEMRRELVAFFDPLYPAKSDPLNRELCMLLVFLEDPAVVPKSMALLAAGASQEQQVHCAYYIRAVPFGWTPELRRAFFKWFNMATVKFRGGASLTKYLANFKRDAVAALPEADKKQLGDLLADVTPPPAAPLKPRAYVKDWRLGEILPEVEKPLGGRNFGKGKAAFEGALCQTCHRLGFDGGTVGPDLTAVGNRFSRRDLLESIMEPSKVVMEQYQTTTLFKKGGDAVTGRLVDEDDTNIVLITNPFIGDRTEVPKAAVERRERSPISPMPPGLVNILTKEEILDLVAYLQAGGDPTHPAFKP